MEKVGEWLGGLVVFLIWGTLLFVGFGTWVTHLARCFSEGEWGFLIAGAIFFPIANVHGLGIWLGWW